MNTKEWLSQGKHINHEIRALQDALSQTKILSEFCDKDSKNEYISVLNNKISQLNQTNSDLLSAIYEIDNNVLRTLLIERFINNKTWEKVAIILGYDFYHVVKRLYPKAVAEIEKNRH